METKNSWFQLRVNTTIITSNKNNVKVSTISYDVVLVIVPRIMVIPLMYDPIDWLHFDDAYPLQVGNVCGRKHINVIEIVFTQRLHKEMYYSILINYLHSARKISPAVLVICLVRYIRTKYPRLVIESMSSILVIREHFFMLR